MNNIIFVVDHFERIVHFSELSKGHVFSFFIDRKEKGGYLSPPKIKINKKYAMDLGTGKKEQVNTWKTCKLVDTMEFEQIETIK